MKKLASQALLGITAGVMLAGGCSSVGKVSKGALVEAELVGTWKNQFGSEVTFRADGSYRVFDAVGQWAVDYPYLRFTGPGGRTSTWTLTSSDFETEPNTLNVSGAGGVTDKLTRSSR